MGDGRSLACHRARLRTSLGKRAEEVQGPRSPRCPHFLRPRVGAWLARSGCVPVLASSGPRGPRPCGPPPLRGCGAGCVGEARRPQEAPGRLRSSLAARTSTILMRAARSLRQAQGQVRRPCAPAEFRWAAGLRARCNRPNPQRWRDIRPLSRPAFVPLSCGSWCVVVADSCFLNAYQLTAGRHQGEHPADTRSQLSAGETPAPP